MRHLPLRFVVPMLVALSAAVLGPQAASAATCAGAGRAPAELGRTATAHSTLCLLNRERAARGLPALRTDGRLRRAAARHAGDMVARRYFAHTSKSGTTFVTRIKRTGWTRSRRSWTVGENLGYGCGSLASPREIVRGWMHSPGHRANILARHFRVIGIGVADGAPTGAHGATYATDFGG